MPSRRPEKTQLEQDPYTANYLGISGVTLWKMIKELNISSEPTADPSSPGIKSPRPQSRLSPLSN
ncbi:MAG: hypothetical protein MZV64_71265 [Ignavibacteriales bacterium]|nr:hypothetical protein [Ignavibacteriales bacterium]